MARSVLHAASIFWRELFDIRVKQKLSYSGIRNVYQHNKAYCFLSSPTTTINSIQFFTFIYVLSSTVNGQLLSQHKYEQQQQVNRA
jgi:hypothetical protein